MLLITEKLVRLSIDEKLWILNHRKETPKITHNKIALDCRKIVLWSGGNSGILRLWLQVVPKTGKVILKSSKFFSKI